MSSPGNRNYDNDDDNRVSRSSQRRNRNSPRSPATISVQDESVLEDVRNTDEANTAAGNELEVARESTQREATTTTVPGAHRVGPTHALSRRAARKEARSSVRSSGTLSTNSIVGAVSEDGQDGVDESTQEEITASPGAHRVGPTHALSRRAARKEARSSVRSSGTLSTNSTVGAVSVDGNSDTHTNRERYKGQRAARKAKEGAADVPAAPKTSRRVQSGGNNDMEPPPIPVGRTPSIGNPQLNAGLNSRQNVSGRFRSAGQDGDNDRINPDEYDEQIRSKVRQHDAERQQSNRTDKTKEKETNPPRRPRPQVRFDSAPPQVQEITDRDSIPDRPVLVTDPEKNLAYNKGIRYPTNVKAGDKLLKDSEKQQAKKARDQMLAATAGKGGGGGGSHDDNIVGPPRLLRDVPVSLDPAQQKHLVGAVRERGINSRGDEDDMDDYDYGVDEPNENEANQTDAYTRFAHTPDIDAITPAQSPDGRTNQLPLNAPVSYAPNEEEPVQAGGGRSKLERTSLFRFALIVCVVIAVAVIAIVVGVLLSGGGGGGGGGAETTTPVPSSVPTSSPTMMAVEDTVCARTLPRFVKETSPEAIAELEGALSVFANETVAGSPERLALCWLALFDRDMSSGSYDTSSLSQRFVLSTIAYSFLSSEVLQTEWNIRSTNECTWRGISCTSADEVNSIILTNNDLAGTIPTAISLLTKLGECF